MKVLFRLAAAKGDPSAEFEVGARLELHARGNFLRAEFEQEVGHHHASHPLCAIHAAQAPFASSRTRPI